MTNTQLVALGVRLFSVWLFVYVLRYVPALWQFNVTESDSSANVAVAISTVIVFGVVAVLWYFPLTVAGKLLPRDHSETKLGLPLEEVQSVAFSLLGLWMVANAIPSASYWILMAYHAAKPVAKFSLEQREFASIFSIGVQLVLGIWLLFGARGLRRLLRWARSAGS